MIHRGLNQVGGCITEIWTNTSRVFIDFGQNLPGCGESTTSEQDFSMVIDIMRPLQNSLFKICSFHHIFVPL